VGPRLERQRGARAYVVSAETGPGMNGSLTHSEPLRDGNRAMSRRRPWEIARESYPSRTGSPEDTAPEPSAPVGAGDWWETTDGTGRFGQAARDESRGFHNGRPCTADGGRYASAREFGAAEVYGKALGPDWPLRSRDSFASASGSAHGPSPRCWSGRTSTALEIASARRPLRRDCDSEPFDPFAGSAIRS
jgi:hypothetical protein